MVEVEVSDGNTLGWHTGEFNTPTIGMHSFVSLGPQVSLLVLQPHRLQDWTLYASELLCLLVSVESRGHDYLLPLLK